LAFVQSIFPLSIPIFSFLKKKGKGFPLQSGLEGRLWVFSWKHPARIAQKPAVKIHPFADNFRSLTQYLRRFRLSTLHPVPRHAKNFDIQNARFQLLEKKIEKKWFESLRGWKSCVLLHPHSRRSS